MTLKMRPRRIPPTAITLFLGLVAGSANLAWSATANAEPLPRAIAALDAGDPQTAESLYALAALRIPPALRHAAEITAARLAASRGDWRSAESRLRAWKDNPARREGSGDVLFWLGWAALHQGRNAEADSLLVLASAYSGESRAQEALEYRFAALLDPTAALRDYLRGLPESPLPEPLRAASLERVPENSRLHPQAHWHLALIRLAQGDTLGGRQILGSLAREGASSPARRAAAYLALLGERENPDSSRASYEALLLQQQQGVAAELARKRTQTLRQGSGK